MKKNKDAFVEDFYTVKMFKEAYTTKKCLIKAVILESDDKSIEKYALVRVFVDLVSEKQPYVIFIDNKDKLLFIDLISESTTIEKIVNRHEKESLRQEIFGVGTLTIENGLKFLDEGKVDDLAASLLWSVDSETNLDPKVGLKVVEKFLNPIR